MGRVSLSGLGAAVLAACSLAMSATPSAAQSTVDGALRMEVIAAPNFVVDSNVETPSSNSPSAAHLGVKIFNTGTVPLTDVAVSIGQLIDPATSSGTPGLFPSRTVTVSGSGGYSGTFALQMPGGAPDAVRHIPRIEPGQWVVQYFFVTYPLKDPSGKSVAGSAPNPEDDLWLNYDIWATAQEAAATRRVSKTSKVTMRNEISAMANKIWPNTTSKVPDKYLDAIERNLGWRPNTETPQSGVLARLEGIWYDLGNVGAGFDNNGDGIPDRNAWMQPVGNPALYDPLCFRLVKSYGALIIKLNNGTEKIITFQDQLYFENIPSNNTGAVGLVFYEFMPLAAGCTAQLTPYQEVASGYDNEKFNADYGTPGGILRSAAASVDFDKSGPLSVNPGATAAYSITAINTGTSSLGMPAFSLPLIIEDSVPAGLAYVAGSATASNTIPAGSSLTVVWSTDGGATYSATEPAPASVTHIRWILGTPLAAGASATVGFSAVVPASYAALAIDNTGTLKLGPSGQLASDTVRTAVTGINSIGDLVWRDLNRNGIQDGGSETGIGNISVRLHHDVNGNGMLDEGEPLLATTETNSSGLYAFNSLPDGHYIVEVDAADPDVPAGFSLPSEVSARIAVALDPARTNSAPVVVNTADWPFISALEVRKTVSPDSYLSGALVTYTLDLENHSAAVAPKTTPTQISWSTTVTANRSSQNPADAQGPPDSIYARIDQTQSADNLANSGLSFPNPTGTITKVEYIFNGFMTQPLVDDQLTLQINGSNFATIPTATINTWTGAAAIRAIDITSLNPSWTWSQVQSLTGNLRTNKTASGDAGVLRIDSIGFRVTVSSAPPPAGSHGPATLNPLPLTDTFDASKLRFVSASIAPSTVGAGSLVWNNLGPLHAGARTTLEVTFEALQPPDINSNGEPDPTTTVNVAASSGAQFVTGLPVNDSTGEATVTINPSGRIGDLVWWDLNNNGTRDAGEPGLANVLLTLSTGAQMRTDAAGAYLFTGLPNGTYTVTIDTATLPWTSFTQTADPDGVFNHASTVTINTSDGLSNNDSFLDRDFGYRSTLNVISGSVFQDNNGNGTRQAGENFLSGITVALTGPVNTSTTTDANGYYAFGSLPNGTYTVTVTPPPSSIQTLDPDSTLNNATSVFANGGNLYPNRDFAYQPSGPLSIGSTLYRDCNGNGVQNSGEEGIADVDILLYEDSNGDGLIQSETDALIAVVSTNASGIYSFGGLVAGSYIVIVDTGDPQFPTGVRQTQDFDGVLDHRAKVNLSASLSTVNFGYQPHGSGRIGDLVFIDRDGSGGWNAGEPGLSSVGVTLYEDTANNGVIDPGIDAVVQTTVTGAGGAYQFTNLAPGNYLVDVDQNAAAIPVDSFGHRYRATTADPHHVALAPGAAYLLADFGFAAPASIGDFVFFDTNGNGTQDFSEAGIPGVTVRLFADANADGLPDTPTPLATTTTASGSGADPAGVYRFTNLPAGTYFVQVLASSLPQSGGQPLAQTSDPDRDGIPVSNHSIPGLPPGDHADSLVVAGLGGAYNGADFGYQPAGALGDFVWLDLNQNGLQDPGEPGIANVSITITNGSTSHAAVTDFDGYWSVAHVGDGPWTAFVNPSNFSPGGPLAGMAATYDADGGTDASASFVLADGEVSLPAGNLGLDFGFALDGSLFISGTVLTHDTRVMGTADDIDDFFDDGVDQDAGPLDEIELGGMQVYLYRADGVFLGSTTTDSRGRYRFEGLPAGQYRVILSIAVQELANSSLTTTAANHPDVSAVQSNSSTVIQTLTLGAAGASRVDFAFVSNAAYDYGDLPLSYGISTLAQDGARHVIPPGGSTIYLGTAPDADTNGMPGSHAGGDDLGGLDDEDGITPVTPAAWTHGQAASGAGGQIEVTVNGSGWLVGWIDWNGDKDFLDSGEMVVSRAVNPGSTVVSFDIPAGTLGAGTQSWLSRFRVFTVQPDFPLFSYTGTVEDGEVEDHLIERSVGASIGDLVWADSNGDGLADPGERGLSGVVVELRDEAGLLVTTQTTSDGSQDVDGDGLTDPAGYYRFTGLAAGTYSVVIPVPPTGYLPGYDEDGVATPNQSTVILPDAHQHATADFGYLPLLADISGQVRYDLDADGDLDDPDPGAMMVLIRLWTDPDGDGNPADGVLAGETYTSSSGHYRFRDIPTGSYVISSINHPGSLSTADVDGPNDDLIAVALAGEDVSGRDFLDTMPPLYSVSGRVFDDSEITNDDFPGADDIPLPQVTVRLFFDRDASGTMTPGDTELGAAQTNSAGLYLFEGLPPGNYVLEETDPAPAWSEWDAEGEPDDNMIGLAISGSSLAEMDFLDDGYLGSISGAVLADFDGDNLPDAPLPGVTIELKDENGDTIATTVTEGTGEYHFANLFPGIYTIHQTQPDGYYSLADADGGNPNVIGDVTPVNLAAGDALTGLNFIEVLAGQINGTVTRDVDGNGTGDLPLSGVLITLLDEFGATVATTNSDTDGYYEFLNLAPGDYTVVETDPAGYQSVTPNSVPATVLSGQITTVDFVDEQLGAISGCVHEDLDGDGDGDRPISSVTITLLDELGAAVMSSLTDSFGIYRFENVPPGSYVIAQTQPPGLNSTRDVDVTPDDPDSPADAPNDDPLDDRIPVTLAAGETDDGNDFIEHAPASISGHVLADTNNDTTGEAPLSGVTLTLQNAQGDPLSTVLTDASGFYQFTNLSPGTYRVAQAQPPGFVSVTDKDGGDLDLIGDTSPLAVIPGEINTGNDFVERVGSSHIYNAITGELVAGGSVAISGPGSVIMVLDGSSGSYAFMLDPNNPIPGSYTVALTPPPGFRIDPTRPVAGASFDPAGGPNPAILGAPASGAMLADHSAGANPYYLTLELAPGDPVILQNNLPVVPSKATTWGVWQYLNPLGGNNTPGGNPDGDRYDNLQEFAFCFDAASGLKPRCPISVSVDPATARIDVRVLRVTGISGVTYTLQVISSLDASPAGWSDVTSITPVVSFNADGTEWATYQDVGALAPASPALFFRVRVELDEDLNGTPEAVSRTETAGFARRTFATQCETFSMPFLKCDLFAGVVDSVGGQALNIAASMGSDDFAAALVPGTQYYVEVISGDLAGHRFEVNEAASTATAVAIDTASPLNTRPDLPALLAGSQIAVRAHHSLDQVFDKSAFTGANDPTTADRVQFHLGNAFSTYWLFANGGSPRWVLLGDATLADQGSRLLPPAVGQFVRIKSSSVSRILSGMVRSNAMVVPLIPGSNFTGGGWPLDQSPLGRSMTTASQFTGTNNPATADKLQLWKGDSIPNRSGYDGYFLLTSGSFNQWTPEQNASLSNENASLLLRSLRAVFILSRAGNAGYVMPNPWTP